MSSSILLTFWNLSKSFSVNCHFTSNCRFLNCFIVVKYTNTQVQFCRFYSNYITKWQTLHFHLIPSSIMITFRKLSKSFSVNCHISLEKRRVFIINSPYKEWEHSISILQILFILYFHRWHAVGLNLGQIGGKDMKIIWQNGKLSSFIWHQV